MPQLGLHPDQSAAQERPGLQLLQVGRTLRTRLRRRSAAQPRKDRSPLARRGRNDEQRRVVPAQKEQRGADQRLRKTERKRPDRRGRHGVRSRPHHPRHRSTAPRNAVHAHRRRARDLLEAGARTAQTARNDDRRGIGCHRQRVRLFLCRAGCEGHHRRVSAPDHAPRRRRGRQNHGTLVPQAESDHTYFDHREIGESQCRRQMRRRGGRQEGHGNAGSRYRPLGRRHQIQHRGDRPGRVGHQDRTRQSHRR